MSIVQKLQDNLAALRQRDAESNELVDVMLELSEEQMVSNTSAALMLAKEGLEISRRLQYPHGEAYSLALIGYTEYMFADFESALVDLEQALSIALGGRSEMGQARIYSVMAMVHRSLGNFDQAFSCALKALKIFEAHPGTLMHAWILNSLGGIHHDLKDFERSLKYHQDSLAMFEKLSREEPDNAEIGVGRARALTGMGTVYQSRGDLNKAMEYHREALGQYRKLDNPEGESRALNDLGILCQECGVYDKSLEYLNASIAIREKLDMRQALAGSLLELGRLYLRTNRNDDALAVLQRALDLATALKARPRVFLSHQLLSQAHEAAGDYKSALTHFRIYQDLQQQVYSNEANARVKNLQVSLEVEGAEKMAAMEQEKNRELQEKNEQLEQLLAELSATQSQLVHSEKMAALGSLVAGVVHEINTPLGVMTSANDVIKRCVAALAELHRDDGISVDRDSRLVRVMLENQTVLESALERLLALMRSLKTFSRLDEASFQQADIHEGINSALQLLEPELNGRIKLEKNFGEVPAFPHYPGELNQVFMNLLRNAVESIRDDGKISITTKNDKHRIKVIISDSGTGIPQQQLEHLFEPTFSRKGSRIKAGLGLFAAYNIVKKHQGDIKVESEIGRGTTVTLDLPTSIAAPR